MADVDRCRWNARFEQGEHASAEPSPILVSLASYLPESGTALDVAGGAGRNAIWLAQQGLRVTLADLSDVGLELASRRAQHVGFSLRTLQVDLEEEPLPAGPWQLILFNQFLWRPLFGQVAANLAPGGVLIVIHPTESNLLRNRKPSRRFLLQQRFW